MRTRTYVYFAKKIVLHLSDTCSDACVAFIHGLYLEGAHWNGTFIDEQLHLEPFELFPMIRLQVSPAFVY